MQLAVQIVILLTAIVGLASAYYAYRSARPKQISTSSESKVKLIRIDSDPISKLRWRFWQACVLVAGLMAIINGGILLYMVSDEPIFWSAVLLALFTPAWFHACWKILRRRPWEEHSLVQRKTSVEVQGDYETVFSQCEMALRTIGARITGLDRSAGVIEAQKRSSGTKLVVALKSGGGKSYTVTVESDSLVLLLCLTGE